MVAIMEGGVDMRKIAYKKRTKENPPDYFLFSSI